MQHFANRAGQYWFGHMIPGNEVHLMIVLNYNATNFPASQTQKYWSHPNGGNSAMFSIKEKYLESSCLNISAA